MNATPVPVTDLDIRVVAAPLGYEARAAAEIAAGWSTAAAANSALYDGPILLFSAIAAKPGGTLAARAHRTRFSVLLALVNDGDAEGEAKNLFGSAAILGSDGAFVLGIMGAHTAFPGDVKFVGGTPDLSDVDGEGRVDILGSIRRELGEETGLAATEAEIEPVLRVVTVGALVSVVAVLRFPEPAAAIARRIEAFLASETDPELAGVAVVATTSDLDGLRLPSYTRSFLVHHFA
jgi:hypothetical protein